MAKRNRKSPREVLSLFSDVARRKKEGVHLSQNDVSIFDVIPTQERSNDQGSAHEPGPQQPDYARPQTRSAGLQGSSKPSYRVPSWKRAEFGRLKQAEDGTAAKAAPCQVFRQEAGEQMKDKPFAPVIVAGSKWKKIMKMLVLVLVVVFIFVLVQVTLGPSIKGLGSSKLVVQGILYTRDNPSAIVNGQVVYEGDMILGVTVIEINKDSVEFEEDKSETKEARRFTKRVRQ